MTAIYKRELRSYFNSMVGWLFIALLVAAVGVYFMVINLLSGYPYFSVSLYNSLMIFMVIVPILSMRSMSEERRAKTDQLLLTSPVSVTRIVLGKYLAMVTVMAIPVAVFCLCPLIIRMNGTAYLAADYAGILAYFLLGCVFVAVGMFVSSLTESAVVSAVGTFGLLLLLYLWDSLVSYLPVSAFGSLICIVIGIILLFMALDGLTGNWVLSAGVGGVLFLAAVAAFRISEDWFYNLVPQLLAKFSLVGVLENFVGYLVFDLQGLIVYLSVIVFFIFLTVQMVQKRRWS